MRLLFQKTFSGLLKSIRLFVENLTHVKIKKTTASNRITTFHPWINIFLHLVKLPEIFWTLFSCGGTALLVVTVWFPIILFTCLNPALQDQCSSLFPWVLPGSLRWVLPNGAFVCPSYKRRNSLSFAHADLCLVLLEKFSSFPSQCCSPRSCLTKLHIRLLTNNYSC